MITDNELFTLINSLPDISSLSDEQLKIWHNTTYNDYLDCQMELYKRKIDFN